MSALMAALNAKAARLNIPLGVHLGRRRRTAKESNARAERPAQGVEASGVASPAVASEFAASATGV